jgi:hypothetical protein
VDGGLAGGSGPSGSGPSGSGVSPGGRVPGSAVSPRASTAARLRQRVATGHEHLQAEELRAHAASVRATPIAESADRQRTVAAGTLRAVTVRPRGNSPALQADLWDGTGNLTLVWLGRRDIPGIAPGARSWLADGSPRSAAREPCSTPVTSLARRPGPIRMTRPW